MLSKGSPLHGLEPAHRALAQGHYETAFALLESALLKQRRAQDQARVMLYLAAAYALYGEDGLEGGLRCLNEAVDADPQIAQDPLYRALYWEFGAYRGDARSDVRRGALAAAEGGDGVAAYHAASALIIVGAYKRARRVLEACEPEALPVYLQWRRYSLLGQALESSGDYAGAAGQYQEAVARSRGSDQQAERLNVAGCQIEAGRADLALTILAQVEEDLLEPVEQAVRRYLEGRAHLALGNPNQALEWLLRARLQEEAAGEPSYGLYVALAQTYASLGQRKRAIEAYLQALELAAEGQRAVTLHEYAYTLFEDDQLLEARDNLWKVVQDERYPFRAEVYADLAEIEFRLGNFANADDLARRALDLGAVASACLCLGNLACEYYRFDEAVEWFEQAASASREGELDWLVAQEMLADTLVQRGFDQPGRVLKHAEAALRHLNPSEEWAITLRDYAARARDMLGGQQRILN